MTTIVPRRTRLFDASCTYMVSEVGGTVVTVYYPSPLNPNSWIYDDMFRDSDRFNVSRDVSPRKKRLKPLRFSKQAVAKPVVPVNTAVRIDRSKKKTSFCRPKHFDKRRTRNLKSLPKTIPKGYHLEEISTSEVKVKGNKRSFDSFRPTEWVPRVRIGLVPDVKTRHNPKLPRNLLVNGETFYRYRYTPHPFGLITIWDTKRASDTLWSRLSSKGSTVTLFESLGVGALSEKPLSRLDSYRRGSPESLFGQYAQQLQELDSISLSRLYTRIKNQPVDIATELSQAKQTIDMILNLSSRFALALSALKGGHLLSAMKIIFPTTARKAADDRLVYVYGIKPIASDIKALSESLKKISSSLFIKRNGHAKRSWTHTTNVVVADVGVQIGIRETEVKVTLRRKYGVEFSISDSLKNNLSRFGFTSPENILWENVPFSFVIDWLIPIGDYLNNWTALRGIQIKQSYRSTFVEKIVTQTFRATKQTGLIYDPSTLYFFKYWPLGEPIITHSSKEVAFRREVIPLPDLPFPKIDTNFGLSRRINALALLLQKFSK